MKIETISRDDLAPLPPKAPQQEAQSRQDQTPAPDQDTAISNDTPDPLTLTPGMRRDIDPFRDTAAPDETALGGQPPAPLAHPSPSVAPEAATVVPNPDHPAPSRTAQRPASAQAALTESAAAKAGAATAKTPSKTAPDGAKQAAAAPHSEAETAEVLPPEDDQPKRARPETWRDAPRAKAWETPDKPLSPPLEQDRGPILRSGGGSKPPDRKDGGPEGGGGGGGGSGGGTAFHRRLSPENYSGALKRGVRAVRINLSLVFAMTLATNILILAIPIYLFQISDRVMTSRSVDTLIMLTIVIVGAVILQSMLDAIRRFILMRSAVELAAQLGAPILSAAAHASLSGNGREYQTLGDLQQLRGFLTSGTLLSFLDVPFAPLFMLAIFMVHPDLGMMVVVTGILLAVVATVNQKVTHEPFARATAAQSRANLHLDSMTRNSQVINAMAMIPEAVEIWGRDTAQSLTDQVKAQDRNIISASVSRGVRLLAQVGMLGWGAHLALNGEITGGMVIAASIIAGKALAPIEGAIEGWHVFLLTRAAHGRIQRLLQSSKLQFERLWLPRPEGRLDVERLLYVPGGTKQVVLNGISFSLTPGEALAVIGNSGAGKTTLGKMLVGSVLPTSGNVRLDLMDLRNWDPRQLGENIGYLPQDVQLFPGTIKENIGRMRRGAKDEDVFRAAVLADVHDMIAQLPQGYETMVAADGSPLSGGQKQRIALARAFFGNPRFLVLDEPNSNLDVAGDKALAKAIDHARANGITTVVITQKPALLNTVDKIMLLANGGIALFGTRDVVLERLAGQNGGPVSGTDAHGLEKGAGGQLPRKDT